MIVVSSVCASMGQIMQHHGCRSHLRDRSKIAAMEERFDLVVDANDSILEKVVGYFMQLQETNASSVLVCVLCS